MGVQGLALLALLCAGAGTEPKNASHALVGRRRLSDQYAQIAKLVAGDAAQSDKFGGSVAIDGNTVVVGAYGETTNGGLRSTSSARATAAPRTARSPLTASDAPSTTFGRSVAIDGGTVAGRAYGDDDDGSQLARPTSSARPTAAPRTARWPLTADAAPRRTTSAGPWRSPATPSWSDLLDTTEAGSVFRTTDGGATYGQVAKHGQRRRQGDDFRPPWRSTVTPSWRATLATDPGLGSAYVFRTTDGGVTYSQVAKLIGSTATGDWLRGPVAIAVAPSWSGVPNIAGLGGLRLPHDRRRRHVRPGGQADGRRRRGRTTTSAIRGDRRRHRRGRSLLPRLKTAASNWVGLRLPHDRRRRHVRGCQADGARQQSDARSGLANDTIVIGALAWQSTAPPSGRPSLRDCRRPTFRLGLPTLPAQERARGPSLPRW